MSVASGRLRRALLAAALLSFVQLALAETQQGSCPVPPLDSRYRYTVPWDIQCPGSVELASVEPLDVGGVVVCAARMPDLRLLIKANWSEPGVAIAQHPPPGAPLYPAWTGTATNPQWTGAAVPLPLTSTGMWPANFTLVSGGGGPEGTCSFAVHVTDTAGNCTRRGLRPPAVCSARRRRVAVPPPDCGVALPDLTTGGVVAGGAAVCVYPFDPTVVSQSPAPGYATVPVAGSLTVTVRLTNFPNGPSCTVQVEAYRPAPPPAAPSLVLSPRFVTATEDPAASLFSVFATLALPSSEGPCASVLAACRPVVRSPDPAINGTGGFAAGYAGSLLPPAWRLPASVGAPTAYEVSPYVKPPVDSAPQLPRAAGLPSNAEALRYYTLALRCPFGPGGNRSYGVAADFAVVRFNANLPADPSVPTIPNTPVPSFDGKSTLYTAVVFRNGAYGYTGESEVAISNYGASTGFQGYSTFSGPKNVGLDWRGGSATYRTLVKFADLGKGAPPGSTVLESTLTITVRYYGGWPHVIDGFFLAAGATWAASDTAMGWELAGAGRPWAHAGVLNTTAAGGALGPTRDLVGNGTAPAFSFTNPASSSVQTLTAFLPQAAVQRWLDDPSSNNGVLLSLRGDFIDSFPEILGSDASDPVSYRPALSIAYAPAGTAGTPSAPPSPPGAFAPPTTAASTAGYSHYTVTFRNGLSNYSSTQDVGINDYGSDSYNKYAGQSSAAAATMGLGGVANANAKEGRVLLRFADLALPGCPSPASCAVAGAALTLSFTNWISAIVRVDAYYVKTAWTYADKFVGWRYRTNLNGAAAAFFTPGLLNRTAGAASRDLLNGGAPDFTLDGFTAAGAGQFRTVVLNASVVQDWVRSPSLNQGLLLVVRDPYADVQVASSRAALYLRPALSIAYMQSATAPQGLLDALKPPPAPVPPFVAGPATVLSATRKVLYFQQGRQGYQGTYDVAISQQNKYDGYQGITSFLGDTLLGSPPGNSFEYRSLIKFTNIGAAEGAGGATWPEVAASGGKVVSASLVLTFANWGAIGPGYSNATAIEGYYLAAGGSWAAESAALGWDKRSPDASWATPGLLASGGLGASPDLLDSAAFTLTDFVIGGAVTRSLPLDPSVVQSWLDNPFSNNGVLLVLRTAAAGGKATVTLASAEGPIVGNRPLLKIEVSTNATTPTPPALPHAFRRDTSSGRTIYVAANGTGAGSDETGNGEAQAPFATLSYVVSYKAFPGDTIQLAPGTHLGPVRLEMPRITVTSSPLGLASIVAHLSEPLAAIVFSIRPEASGTVLRGVEIAGGHYYPIRVFSKWDWGLPDRSGPTNILIENCKIHHGGSDLINIMPRCDNVTIRNNELYASGFRLKTYGNGIKAYNVDSLRVYDNYIHDVASAGVELTAGCTNAVIERNLVQDARRGISVGFFNELDWFDPVANPLYYMAINTLVRNNVVRRTYDAGIALYSAKSTRILFNTVLFAGMYGQSAVAFTVAKTDLMTESVYTPSDDVTFANNIVVVGGTQGSARTALAIRKPDNYPAAGLAASGTIAGGKNLFFNTAPGYVPAFVDERGGQSNFVTLATWQADATHAEAGSAVADPLLSGYRLTASSPALGAATSAYGVTDDFDGQARPASGGDLGADLFATNGQKADPPTPLASAAGFAGPWPPYRPILDYFGCVSRNIYVSPAGNDATADGSLAKPYRSLKLVLGWTAAIAKACNVVWLRGGVHEAGDVSVSSYNVTLQSYPGEWAIISAPTNDAARGTTIRTVDHDWGFVGGRITLRRLEIRGGYYYPLKFDALGGALVEDCVVHGAGTAAVVISPYYGDVTIRRTEIYATALRTGERGIGIEARGSKNIVVQDCTIHDVQGTAILLDGGTTDALIERNVIYNAGEAGVVVGFYQTTDMMDPIDNPQYYGCIRCVVRNNFIAGTGDAGVAFWSARDSAAVFNTLVGVAQNRQAGVLYSVVPRNTSAWPGYTFYTPSRNIVFAANVLQMEEDAQGFALEVRNYAPDGGLEDPTGPALVGFPLSIGNVYQVSSQFVDRRQASRLYGGLDDWRSKCACENGSYFGDAMLGPSPDARPAPGSPAIGLLSPSAAQAIAWVLPSVDFDGNARPGAGGLYDAGADQTGGAPRTFGLASIRGGGGDVACTNPLGAELFVAATGSDASCDATAAAPLRTVAFALAIASENTTITLRAGTYAETLRVKKRGIVLRAYAGESVTVQGAQVTGGPPNVVRFYSTAAGGAVRGLRLYGGAAATLRVDAPGVEVTDAKIEASGGILVSVQPAARGTTIARCVLANTGQSDYGSGDAIEVVGAEDVAVRDSILYNAVGIGVKINSGARNTLVERNLIANAQAAGVAVWTDGVTSALFTNNGYQPPALNGALTGPTPSALYESIDAVIRNNIIYDVDGPAVDLRAAKGARVDHNTIVRCGSGTAAPLHVNGYIRTVAAGVSVTTQSTGFSITNNIVVPAAASPYALDVDFMALPYPAAFSTYPPGATGTSTVSNNRFNASSPPVRDSRVSMTTVAYSGPVATWQAQTGVGTASANTVGDVGFLSGAAFPFAISSTSACKDAAAASTTSDDFFGAARSAFGAPDIGALEYGSASAPSAGDVRGPSRVTTPSWRVNMGGNFYYPGYSQPYQAPPCPIYPANHAWNTDISNATRYPVHPLSSDFVNFIGAAKAFHPDFGTPTYYGIPYVYVDGTVPKRTLAFQYDPESDHVQYPIPDGVPIEGGQLSNGDRHVLVIDKTTCKLYETWRTFPIQQEYRTATGPAWLAGSGAVFDLVTGANRPIGWTSADAAGLAIYPGLVKYEEVAADNLKHAIRFTVTRSGAAYIRPATHWASSITDPAAPPMGLRLRLKSSIDCATRYAGFPQSRVICVALQKYGIINADNGGDWFISGTSHPNWDDADLNQLKSLSGSDFEAVYTGPTCTTYSDSC